MYGQAPLPPPPGQNGVPPPPTNQGTGGKQWENAPPYVYRKMQEMQKENADLKEARRAQDEVELAKIRNQELHTAVGLAVEGTLSKGLGTIVKKLGGANRTTFTGGLNRSLRKRDSAESAEEAESDPKGGSMWDALAGFMASHVPKKNRKTDGNVGSSQYHRKQGRSPSRRQTRRDRSRRRDSRSPSHRRPRSPSRRRRNYDRRNRSHSRSRPHGRSRTPPRRSPKRSPTPRRSRTQTRRTHGRGDGGGGPKKNRQLTPFKAGEKKEEGAINAEAITQLLTLCGGPNPIDDAQFPKWDTDLNGFLKELAKAPTVNKEKLDGLLENNGFMKGFTNAKMGELQQLLNFICNAD